MPITEEDWRVLEILGANPARADAELQKWVETGYINLVQAADIRDELVRRSSKWWDEYAYNLPAKEQAIRLAQEEEARQEQLKAEQWRAAPLTTKLSPEAYRRYGLQKEWAGARPDVEYEPAAGQLMREFEGEMPQTGTWVNWLQAKLEEERSRFQAGLPKFESKFYPGLMPEEASKKIEKSWAEVLKKRKPEIKESWYKQSEYQRGERTAAHAPRIQMVGWR